MQLISTAIQSLINALTSGVFEIQSAEQRYLEQATDLSDLERRQKEILYGSRSYPRVYF